MMMEWKKLLSPHRVGSSRPGEISQARSPFQRDFDRIVFSGSFRRLQDKTQVFPLAKTDYVRTRLTHSLEASSVGRSLGSAAGVFLRENFDLGDAQPSDVGAAVAAAALAHDIGNPPLGHAGEEAIRHWFTHSPVGRSMRDVMNENEAADFEFYEGNAQGFRVLTRLEMPDQTGGMQLTCATLAAFAKYPCASRVAVKPGGVAGKKFNFFRSEEALFREMAEHTGLIPVGEDAWLRHPLAYLVEAADDIAYRIVDFEDGQRLGLVSYQELERLFLEIIDSERSAEYVATIDSPLRKAEFLRAQVIGRLVRECTKVFIDHHEELLNGTLEKPLLAYIDCQEPLRSIERRSTKDIYQHRAVAEVIGAGFEMVSGMLDIFVPCVNEMALEADGGKSASFRSRRLSALLPDMDANLADGMWRRSSYLRLLRVLDYISGMTDSYAVSLYQKLKGISL
ncbi:deoxyguanosinetriphosphate triphosphohydrolase [uncultured Victivallis sp.]|uniref:deoxyguanosinetriphosphate triphosphohydrolase n=1 Tax=uncultured Victivallis sp. TaxID=354118 RepID=UPI0025E44986|nr:deoxyguanosinetriphosphate triphosphohydrolase [uncultured Victivallis sp.]